MKIFNPDDTETIVKIQIANKFVESGIINSYQYTNFLNTGKLTLYSELKLRWRLLWNEKIL